MLYDIRPEGPRQPGLFEGSSQEGSSQEDEELMEDVDRINRQMGRGTVGFAAVGIKGKRVGNEPGEVVATVYDPLERASGRKCLKAFSQ